MGRKKDEPLIYNSFEELLDILAEERRKSLRKRRRIQMVATIYGLFVCVMLLLAVFTNHHISSYLGTFSSFGGMIAGMYAVTEKQRKGMQALTAFEDVRAVPHLITALEYNDRNVKAVAANALPGLLRRLQASDTSLLTKEHYAILNRVLKSNLNMKAWDASMLRLAIVNALQQIGDEGSLSLVEEMAQGKGKAVGDPEVRRAAEECLPYLRLRAENQRQTQTLLRASDGSSTPVEMLLRPAADRPTPACHTEELLRVPASTSDTQAVAQPVFAVHEARQAEPQELRLH